MLRAALVATTLLAACQRPAAPTAPPATAAAAPAPTPSAAAPSAAAGAPSPSAPAAAKAFGQPLAPATAVPIASVLGTPDKFANSTVTVEGAVRKACTRKGCWMELAETAQEGTHTPGCRVTFKDYGFFVPIDAAGSRARVQGKVEVGTLSASSVRHYEEEGAAFAGKQPDGTAREVRLVATGVQLWRAN
jgi:hypothetical protein